MYVIRHTARICIAILTLLFPLQLAAQLTVAQGSGSGMTPQEFVEAYLVGQGVTVMNATFNDLPDKLNSSSRPLPIQDQIGSFATAGGAFTQLGINGGVIMSTGKVQSAIVGGTHSTNTGGGSDPDLVILATPVGEPQPIEVNDKSILEFDFIPETDLVTFRYVFSSNEFDTYCPEVGNPFYNDAFGLFLSGPGISGGAGFQNDAINIAFLPSSTVYVNIANICSVDKGNTTMNGVYSWWNSPKIYFSYNRFAYVFTASQPVTCGQIYHMKFAIGDAWDPSWDSGVFLEQNSFSSTDITATTSFSNPFTGDFLIPDCSNADLVHHIPQPKASDVVIGLSIDPSGTASQADILPNPFPTQVIIPAGSLSTTPIIIQAFPTGIPGPDRTLVIKASNITCAATTSITTSIVIKYNEALSLSVPPQSTCDGTPATLTATVSGGQPQLPSNSYSYLWSNAATTPSITVSPGPGNNLYSVTVSDACNQSISRQTSVDVSIMPIIPGVISGPSEVCPPLSNIIYSVSATPGAESYHWSLPAGTTITGGNNTNSISVSFGIGAVSGPISVYGSNAVCGNGPPSVPLFLTINAGLSSAGPISGPSTVCQGQTGTIYSIPAVPNATSYVWSLPPNAAITGGDGTNNITVAYGNNAVSGILSVYGHNPLCGDGPVSAGYSVLVNPKPTASFLVCTPLITVQNGLKIQLKGGYPLPGIYFGTEGVALNPVTGKYEFDPSVVTGPFPKVIPITYRFENSLTCRDEKSQSITVLGLNSDIISTTNMKDLRDNRLYTFSTFGSGASARSWMTQNLAFGNGLPVTSSQTDNCIIEKYCPPTDPSCTGSGGGYYQWDELMEYQAGQGSQDLCPPGWHVPSLPEWQHLIDNLDAAFLPPSANAMAGAELKDNSKPFSAFLQGIDYQNSSNWYFSQGLITGAMFWTSTPDGANKSFARGLCDPYNSSISLYSSGRSNAFSVRCLRN